MIPFFVYFNQLLNDILQLWIIIHISAQYLFSQLQCSLSSAAPQLWKMFIYISWILSCFVHATGTMEARGIKCRYKSCCINIIPSQSDWKGRWRKISQHRYFVKCLQIQECCREAKLEAAKAAWSIFVFLCLFCHPFIVFDYCLCLFFLVFAFYPLLSYHYRKLALTYFYWLVLAMISSHQL